MWRRLKDMVLGVFIGGFLVTGIIAAVASDGSSVSEWTRLLPFSQTNLMIMKQARSVIEMYHIVSCSGMQRATSALRLAGSPA